MRLWHYTARHHLDGGVGHAGPGITHAGILPNPHPAIALGGLVWLTDDPDWRQEWSPRPVPLGGETCDRTEVRVEVAIPKYYRDWLFDYPDWSACTDPRVLPDLVAFGDPFRWFVFGRRIPPGWLRSIEERP